MVWSISQRMAARRHPGKRQCWSRRAGTQESPLRYGGAVPVDRDDGAVDGIGEHARERVGLGSEAPRSGGVDGRAADQVDGSLVGTEEGEGRHDDLHLGADRTERSRPVAVRGRIERRRARQQQVAEHVGTHLISGARIVVVRSARIDDDRRLLREAVHDPFRDDGRNRRDEVGHALGARHHTHPSAAARLRVPFGE